MPLRVLLFTDSDVFAGTERYIAALASAMPADRVRVSVGCPAPSPLADAATAAGAAVVPIAKGGVVDWPAIGQLCKMLKSHAIHLIHAHNGRTALNAALAVRLARQGKVVVTQHFLMPDHLRRGAVGGWLHRRSHAWVNRSIDHFIAISDAVRSAMIERGEAVSSKITMIANGIVPPESRLLSARNVTREELGIAGDVPLIVCVARLQPEKDIPTLVRAMRRVVLARPNAVCMVVGEGCQDGMIRKMIGEYGLADNVRMLGFREDAAALMAAGDLFVLPSLAEPFGLVLLEAMALQRPVVATRAGGPAEIVRDGETGLLVPPGEAPALAAAILRVLEAPGLCRSMGQSGRERFEQRYTAERMAAATASVYEQVMIGQAAADRPTCQAAER